MPSGARVPECVMDSLKERIRQDTAAAMRARDRARVAALRLVAAEIKQREVDSRQPLDDSGVLAVLDRMLKQRRDSAEQFRAAGRDELAATETFEIEVIESYLPRPPHGAGGRGAGRRGNRSDRCIHHARHGRGHGPASSRGPGPCGHGRGEPARARASRLIAGAPRLSLLPAGAIAGPA